MPYARECECERPLQFTCESCARCGKPARVCVTASTMRLAVAIAEVAFGLRKVGDRTGREGKRPTGECVP